MREALRYLVSLFGWTTNAMTARFRLVEIGL